MSELTATFTDQSYDPDGTVVAWSWNFGDGGTSTQRNPTRTYAAAGTYTVSLTVTDNEGATDSTSKNVTVSVDEPPPGDEIVLSATGYKVRGVKHADLTWSGATSNQVDLLELGDGEFLSTVPAFYQHTARPGFGRGAFSPG